MSSNAGTKKWLGKSSFLVYFLENWYNFFYKWLVDFISEAGWTWIFLYGKISTLSISIIDVRLFRLFLLEWAFICPFRKSSLSQEWNVYCCSRHILLIFSSWEDLSVSSFINTVNLSLFPLLWLGFLGFTNTFKRISSRFMGIFHCHSVFSFIHLRSYLYYSFLPFAFTLICSYFPGFLKFRSLFWDLFPLI